MSTRSLPSWRSRSAASHSLGSGHKGNHAPRREHPGSWAGLRARRPFFGKSGVASSWLPWHWWVVSDFPKPPSRAPRAPRSVGSDVSPSGPPGVGGLATHPSRGLGLLQLQSPPAESPLRPPPSDDQAGACRVLLRLALVVTCSSPCRPLSHLRGPEAT